MLTLEIALLGLALAIDAAVVTFAVGIMHLDHLLKKRVQRGLLLCTTFGIFQALMLWLGSYGGYLFTFSSFGHYFQVGIGFIFLTLAFKMVHESFSLEEKKIEWGVIPVIMLAFATSIDALAAGVGLATLPGTHLAAMEVGFITFFVCGSFYFLSQFFRQIPDKWLLRFASLIFFFLGGRVLWDIRHLFIRGQ